MEGIAAQSKSVVVAHDYFTQRGGAERVASIIIELLKPTRVVTALYDKSQTFTLPQSQFISTSFLQRVSIFRKDPRRALILFPFAWSLISPVRASVVICSSSGWSHAIRTSANTRKIVYCHNPARWLYQPDDYFKEYSLLARSVVATIRPLLKSWDRRAANSADLYLANSRTVAQRIREIYGIEPIVLHPPVSLNHGGDMKVLDAVKPGYYLVVGRGRGYKNIDLLLSAFAMLPNERLLVVGSSVSDAPSNITFLTHLSEAELRWTYANARALVSVSHEDFGLTPLEANKFGTPALVLRAGGFLDSLAEGVSGQYIDSADLSTIVGSIKHFPHEWDRDKIRAHADKFSKEAFAKRLEGHIQEVVGIG